MLLEMADVWKFCLFEKRLIFKKNKSCCCCCSQGDSVTLVKALNHISLWNIIEAQLYASCPRGWMSGKIKCWHIFHWCVHYAKDDAWTLFLWNNMCVKYRQWLQRTTDFSFCLYVHRIPLDSLTFQRSFNCLYLQCLGPQVAFRTCQTQVQITIIIIVMLKTLMIIVKMQVVTIVSDFLPHTSG